MNNRIKEKLMDRGWRLNNLYYLYDKLGRKIKFKLNVAQTLIMGKINGSGSRIPDANH